ncbi:hypothetical protein [Streptomyces sp. S.PB5]|uniref:hypothetical protein n=1 Tax=Streptomyces sp. S.PB5 TaxID=3020844 RepID=UPI0025AF9718|nr:hypothetical protein [Streptomyces sp. S.PB5]MDN3025577.1 hypothetical protein [Streptomyces sp. S.PB5]
MALLRERQLSAYRIGAAGNASAALRLLTGLEADCRTRLGDDAWFTLVVRHGIAYWTGVCGGALEAREQTRRLLDIYRGRLDAQDHERSRGHEHDRDHSHTHGHGRRALRLLRDDLARWTGEAGDPGEAARQYAELRRDTERALGPDAPETLLARHNTAYWTAAQGAHARVVALADFRALLDDEHRVNGPAHPHTLAVRHNIAHWTEAEGDPHTAHRLFTALLHDRTTALGREHPHTLLNAFHVARLTRDHTDTAAGATGLVQLSPHFARVFGDDHPWTRRLRRELGAGD